MDLGQYEKVIRFINNDFNCVIAGNFDVVGQDMNPAFPFGGIWYDYLTGDSLDVSNPGNAFSYQPGEFHVYTDRRIIPPANTYGEEPNGVLPLENTSNILVYPNPFNNELVFNLTEKSSNANIRICDITGRVVFEKTNTQTTSSNQLHINASQISSGLYIYTVSSNGSSYSGKIVKP
jgi:hypothetical protein